LLTAMASAGASTIMRTTMSTSIRRLAMASLFIAHRTGRRIRPRRMSRRALRSRRRGVPSTVMAVSQTKTIVISVVLAALMLVCLADVVHAVASARADNAGCDNRSCDEQSGCDMGATSKPTTPLIVAVVTRVVVPPPPDAVPSVRTVDRSPLDQPAIVASAPRSPPSA
jgi:hypothetical protein